MQRLSVKGVDHLSRAPRGGITPEHHSQSSFHSPHSFHHSLPIFPVTFCPSRSSPEMSVMWAHIVEASQAILSPWKGLGDFARGKTILWQTRITCSETAHLGTLWLEYDVCAIGMWFRKTHLDSEKLQFFRKAWMVTSLQTGNIIPVLLLPY